MRVFDFSGKNIALEIVLNIILLKTKYNIPYYTFSFAYIILSIEGLFIDSDMCTYRYAYT